MQDIRLIWNDSVNPLSTGDGMHLNLFSSLVNLSLPQANSSIASNTSSLISSILSCLFKTGYS